MAIVIDEAKCTGCGACVQVCPVDALTIENGKAKVSEDCVECCACTGECPVEAIQYKTEGS